MFLKEKRDGTIKGRTCGGRRKQREDPDFKKGDSASPTVSTESVLLSAVVDAHEDRDVATIDLPNFYIQTPQPDDEQVVMRLRGRLAELMMLIAPKIYSPYVVLHNGKRVLYVRLAKAIYGTLKAALLSYKRLRKELENDGYIINPYDVCVANKQVNGSQLTIVWHVDDMKISHVNPDEVTTTIEFLHERYKDDNGKLCVTCGKRHDF